MNTSYLALFALPIGAAVIALPRVTTILLLVARQDVWVRDWERAVRELPIIRECLRVEALLTSPSPQKC
jgi:hypothetical protein